MPIMIEKRGLVTSDSNVALAIAMGLVFGSIAVSIGGFLVYRWWMKQKAEEIVVEKEVVNALPEIEELPSFFSSKTLKRIITGEKRRSWMGGFDLDSLQKKSSENPSIPLSEIRMDMSIPEEVEEPIEEQAKVELDRDTNQNHVMSEFSRDSFAITMEDVEEPRNNNRFSMMPSEMQDYKIYALDNNAANSSKSPASPKPEMPLPTPPHVYVTSQGPAVSSPVTSTEMASSPTADVEPQEKEEQKQPEQTYLASPPPSPVQIPSLSPTKVAAAPKGLPTKMSPVQQSPTKVAPPQDDDDSDEDDAPLGANLTQDQLRRVSQATISAIVLPSNPRSQIRRTSTTSSLRYEL
jgi:hypothetical protein